jgi:hypothetical protein
VPGGISQPTAKNCKRRLERRPDKKKHGKETKWCRRSSHPTIGQKAAQPVRRRFGIIIQPFGQPYQTRDMKLMILLRRMTG